MNLSDLIIMPKFNELKHNCLLNRYLNIGKSGIMKNRIKIRQEESKVILIQEVFTSLKYHHVENNTIITII